MIAPADYSAENSAARALFAMIAAVDVAAVPVLATDRCLARKEQARLARGLFRSLGLRGISVTTPNYSMAQTVDVRMPRVREYVRGEDGYAELTRDAGAANSAAGDKLRQILAQAFPNHDDRSDSQTDYFDACWSFHG